MNSNRNDSTNNNRLVILHSMGASHIAKLIRLSLQDRRRHRIERGEKKNYLEIMNKTAIETTIYRQQYHLYEE
jgi:hypothetical protein